MNNTITHNHEPLEMVVEETVAIGNDFIVANTEVVTLKHLRDDCIVPVFAKDNETTISHFQFIDEVYKAVSIFMDGMEISDPTIRVSHAIKGRIPSAIGKPVKELLQHEKTKYYDRCAFTIDVPSITREIGGNKLSLSIGGVRAYNQENLYSSKSLEKFKLFVGFKNWVCTNLCISTDGLMDSVKVSSTEELGYQVGNLLENFQLEEQLIQMERLVDVRLTESQFTLLVGKLRMLPFYDSNRNSGIVITTISDSQASSMVKDYHQDAYFKKVQDGSINLWSLYNIMTAANKSSYIDKNIQRNANCFELVKHLAKSIKTGTDSWYLN
jgi:hypothetical protein